MKIPFIGRKKKQKATDAELDVDIADVDPSSAAGSSVADAAGGNSHLYTDDFSDVFSQPHTRDSHNHRQSLDFSELDRVADKLAAEQADDDADDGTLDLTKLTKKQRRELERAIGDSMEVYPHLLDIKPRERYIFHSDYMDVDGEVACIMGFFHNESSRDDFRAFWGVNRIPSDIANDPETKNTTVVLFENVSRMSELWVDDHLKSTDRISAMDRKERQSSSSTSGKRSADKVEEDIYIINGELQDNASYLNVHNRLMVKAPTLKELDLALAKISRLYVDRFRTLSIAPYHGEQRQELSSLTDYNRNKRGDGFYYTSTEFAGSYSLVTNGLTDKAGEYVGSMIGDVNNSAVLFDVDWWKDHVVIADSTRNQKLNRAHLSDMWANKISQAALCNNHRVVHFVFNDTKLDDLGPKLDSLTTRIDMAHGDVNMFEVFGQKKDEVALFQTHINKLVLMAKLVLGNSADNLSIIEGRLSGILKEFYVGSGMWAENVRERRDDLRLVGIPHDEVPLLHNFKAYLDNAYEAEKSAKSQDPNTLHAITVLRMLFTNLLDNNSDLFDRATEDSIDAVGSSQRVIYDLSRLMRRGKGLAMAQLVNVIAFAVEDLSEGDVLIFHGTQNMTPEVEEFIGSQLQYLHSKGGRVVYAYDSVGSMIAHQHFNHFDEADYTILGPMSDTVIDNYQVAINQRIPRDLERYITTSATVSKGDMITYLRRGMVNVIFRTNLSLGLSKKALQTYHHNDYAQIGDVMPGQKQGSASGTVTSHGSDDNTSSVSAAEDQARASKMTESMRMDAASADRQAQSETRERARKEAYRDERESSKAGLRPESMSEGVADKVGTYR